MIKEADMDGDMKVSFSGMFIIYINDSIDTLNLLNSYKTEFKSILYDNKAR